MTAKICHRKSMQCNPIHGNNTRHIVEIDATAHHTNTGTGTGQASFETANKQRTRRNIHFTFTQSYLLTAPCLYVSLGSIRHPLCFERGFFSQFCKILLPPGFEPRVSRLQDRHANHYTTAAYTAQQFPLTLHIPSHGYHTVKMK